jgi:DNA-binding transcriptional ArsR family regulator
VKQMTERSPIDGVLAALANPTRRELVDLLLSHGELPVRELAARFDMARPSVSEHLSVLRKAGLVTETRAGRERLYRLEPEPFGELNAWLRPYTRFWKGRLANLRTVLNEDAHD